MSRSVPEWIGKTDDTPVPERVKVRLFERFGGRCAICTAKLFPGRWDADHRHALINGGENRENNLQTACDNCHPKKTREDVAQKSKNYRKRKKDILGHCGTASKRGFQNNRKGKYKSKVGGRTVLRDPPDDDDDICGYCGEGGADKVPVPILNPGNPGPGTPYVHEECEDQAQSNAWASLDDDQRAEAIRNAW